MGTKGSYVLVGHSFGGLVVRLYAARYPEHTGEVAALKNVGEMVDLIARRLDGGRPS